MKIAIHIEGHDSVFEDGRCQACKREIDQADGIAHFAVVLQRGPGNHSRIEGIACGVLCAAAALEGLAKLVRASGIAASRPVN